MRPRDLRFLLLGGLIATILWKWQSEQTVEGETVFSSMSTLANLL